MVGVEYILMAIATLVMVCSGLSVVLLLMFTQAGIMLLILVAFAAVIAAFARATVLAAGLVVPGALTFAGVSDILQFLALAAMLSALFMVGVEGPVVALLKGLGVGRTLADAGFALVHSLTTTLILATVARFVSGVELMTGAALAAGFVGAFGFYLAKLIFVHSGSVSMEEMSLAHPSLEDGDDDR